MARRVVTLNVDGTDVLFRHPQVEDYIAVTGELPRLEVQKPEPAGDPVAEAVQLREVVELANGILSRCAIKPRILEVSVPEPPDGALCIPELPTQVRLKVFNELMASVAKMNGGADVLGPLSAAGPVS